MCRERAPDAPHGQESRRAASRRVALIPPVTHTPTCVRDPFAPVRDVHPFGSRLSHRTAPVHTRTHASAASLQSDPRPLFQRDPACCWPHTYRAPPEKRARVAGSGGARRSRVPRSMLMNLLVRARHSHQAPALERVDREGSCPPVSVGSGARSRASLPRGPRGSARPLTTCSLLLLRLPFQEAGRLQ